MELTGVARYEHLVEMCRELDVVTPEDPYPVWEGAGGPAAVVPLFLLYDYSWRLPGKDLAAAMAHAHETHVVATDEFMLHPDPFPDRAAWCRERVRLTLERLAELPAGLPVVFASHWPLHRGPTRMLRYPQFALWCGTELTEDWHLRFPVAAAVYGHLHIPLTLAYDESQRAPDSSAPPRLSICSAIFVASRVCVPFVSKFAVMSARPASSGGSTSPPFLITSWAETSGVS